MPVDNQSVLDRIDELINKIQAIQRDLRGSKQPASSSEIKELRRLGSEYGELILKMDDSSN